MAENFANNYSTALDGAIDNSQTTFDVVSVSGAPAVNFRIKVENEIMLVTGISSLTFTVSRGQEGTSAASHADATLVTHILTAASIQNYAAGTHRYNGTNLTTTSTSFGNSGMTVTITTGARRCLISFAAMGNNSNAGQSVLYDAAVDGTRIGNDTNGITSVTGTTVVDVSFSCITDVLSAGSHTFTIQFRVTANTGAIQAGDSDRTAILSVVELPVTS